MNNLKRNTSFTLACLAFCFLNFTSTNTIRAQTMPPAPGAAKSVNIPGVIERKLSNGLIIAIVERRNVPLVTVELVVKSGAADESERQAGLANLTASLLTKGTKTRSATQIAEEMEFLGSAIDTGASWNNSVVIINSLSNKLDQSMAIMADAVLNPAFKQEELELLKSQTLDGLTYNLKQPGFLANYVASKYTFGEHPANGTPASLKGISTKDVMKFHRENFQPGNSVLIFTGDVSQANAVSLAEKYFGRWRQPAGGSGGGRGSGLGYNVSNKIVNRILVVDLPNSGQASVNYARRIGGSGRSGKDYYQANVLNSLLGGGYSSRLNQEIRIKRGLSYGAGSSFGWRGEASNFSTRTQTKNESAAEVAELVVAEIRRLREGAIPSPELNPRKAVLTGGFGRNLETNSGMAAQLADLYSFGISANELNSYMKNVNNVSESEIRSFAVSNFYEGDIIIVGDYAKFKDDISKRFPDLKVRVIKASELDLDKLR